VGLTGQGGMVRTWVGALGVANGVFAIAAIGQMMTMASQGHKGREGVRMGLWGAAQGIAFGCGGLFGAAASDIAKLLIGSPAQAYAFVFALEAILFFAAGLMALQMNAVPREQSADGDRPTTEPRGVGSRVAIAGSKS
jgi:MFS transporter, BCD family, chlorophyll transporter